jgi:hypothetical protein
MRIAKRPAELGFNRYDVPRLKKALKRVPDKRLFQRVQAVLWVAQGHAISEVAELTSVSVQTVYNWLKLYLERHHVAMLADAPRSGRPLAAPRITAALVSLATQPAPVGLPDDGVERQTAGGASESPVPLSHHPLYLAAADEGYGVTVQAATLLL